MERGREKGNKRSKEVKLVKKQKDKGERKYICFYEMDFHLKRTNLGVNMAIYKVRGITKFM